MAIGPRGYLVKPPKIAATPRYGLLQVIDPVLITDPHAFAGPLEWEQDLCTSVESLIDNCPPATGHTKSTERDLEFCSADPFVIKGSSTCSTVGRRPEDAFETSRRRLLAWESHELERILWTGETANGQVNPSFHNGNDECDLVPEDVSPGGPLNPAAAIALLEERLTDVVPGGGIIHAPHGLASFLSEQRLINHGCEDDCSKYFTTTGTPIVLGAGYPGTGPGGVSPEDGTTWVFATGPLGIWRGNMFSVPDNLSEAVNRNINDVTVFQERFYAVGFSCALFAVRVNLCSCCDN